MVPSAKSSDWHTGAAARRPVDGRDPVDGERFDRIARALAAAPTRRRLARLLVGGAALGATGALLRPGDGVVAETAGGGDATCRCSKGSGKNNNLARFCRSERCEFDDQCCSRKCFRVSNGFPGSCAGEKICLCRFKGARCGKDCACCSGRCGRDGRCA